MSLQNIRRRALSGLSLLAMAAAVLPQPAPAAPAKAAEARPWLNPKLSADERADLALKAMSLDEQLLLVRGFFGASLPGAPPPLNSPPPPEALGSAGYIPGIPRLGIPALQESDAGLGVANGGAMRPGDVATPLPSGLATASSWNPEIAHAGGAMIGGEAHAKGFNVLLAGGVNLARDPRNGRNFEYAGEDPLLAGVMVGEAIRGVQSRNVISTAKHYAVNDQETGRSVLNAVIPEKVMRETDLLAFQLAIERGDPGSIMCSYNRVNGDYACENDYLLNKTLKRDWGYRGWVMTDWGGAHSTVKAALAGLDQDSAHTFDRASPYGNPFQAGAADYFGAPLKAAVEKGEVPASRVRDMAKRVLRTMFDKGVIDHPAAKASIDYEANAAVARRAAQEGVVLLKNQAGLLPLAKSAPTIAVIGGHADVGVLSGGGSSQVAPVGGAALTLPPTPGPGAIFAQMVFHPSSPLKAIKAAAPGSQVRFADGADAQAAAALARSSDVVVVFATQWQTEAQDVPNLSLPNGQDALIEAVAAANPRTVVVLETGNPVLMPWLDKVGAVLEAWYPGARGGEAIADVLFGEVNPSGKLPITFPRSEAQLPRPKLPGLDMPMGFLGVEQPFDVEYPEGAAIGYKWFESRGQSPLFPFGYGLSYTRFSYGGLKVEGGPSLTVSFDVTNAGSRQGKEIAQVYATPPGTGGLRRLIGWGKVDLKPGETRRVVVKADPRLLAEFDPAAGGWRIEGGGYAVAVGGDSASVALKGEAVVKAAKLKP
ncbi:beta-glucosidase [Caulobacter sp. CCUG 60055]